MKTTLLLGLLALAPQDDPAAKLIAALDAETLVARDEAEAALLALGRPALPALRKALPAATGDARLRLERVLKALTEIRWMTDLDGALAEAKAKGRPLLVCSSIGDLDGYL